MWVNAKVISRLVVATNPIRKMLVSGLFSPTYPYALLTRSAYCFIRSPYPISIISQIIFTHTNSVRIYFYGIIINVSKYLCEICENA